MSRIRLAVIGVGSLGRHHARILSGFDDVSLVGVVDSRPEQGRYVAAQFGTEWFPAAADVMSRVDAVVVAVPTVCHHDVARPFLEAQIPVLVEKPIATNLEESRKMHRLASFRRCTLQVGHVERFNPAFELLQQHVTRPLHIRCQRVSPYSFRSTDIGVVHDLMIHDIDLVLTLTGSSVRSVDAFGAVAFGPHEDMVVARLRMENDTIVDLTASRISPQAERSIQVWCEDRFCSADLHSRKVNLWKPAAPFREHPGLVHQIVAATPNPLALRDEVFSKWIPQEEFHADASDALSAELRDFITSVRNATPPRVTSREALSAMEVADRILAGLQLWSYQTGSHVTQPDRRAA